jgi:hypothetical protein
MVEGKGEQFNASAELNRAKAEAIRRRAGAGSVHELAMADREFAEADRIREETRARKLRNDAVEQGLLDAPKAQYVVDAERPAPQLPR